MSSATLFICSVLVTSILSCSSSSPLFFVKPVNAQLQNNPFSLSNSTANERGALIAALKDTYIRPLFENLSLLNEHQYDSARIVAILQSQYPGAFDDFTYQYTFNATSNKTSLEMDGNGSDFFASGGDKQQIDNIARLFGFQLTGFSQFAKDQELINALETP